MRADDPEPLEVFVEDAQRVVSSTWRRLLDRGGEWFTRWLFGLLVSAIASGALAIALFPVFAGVACALVAIAAVIYAIYAHRLMATARRIGRHATIREKRLLQRALKAEAAVDDAVLALGGDREQRGRMLVRHRELGQGVRHLQSRVRAAAREARPQSRGARQRQEKMVPAPDLAPVRRRQERRKADLVALEAEIQALAMPGDQERSRAATRARETERDLAAATREADRTARDRARRGLSPTAPQGEERIELTVAPDAVRNVGRAPRAATPEQLAAEPLEKERRS